MALPAHSGPWPLNHFAQTVGLLVRVISPPQGRYLNTGQHKHRINTYTHQTSMSWVGFVFTIPASERAKRIHALERAATVTGLCQSITTWNYRKHTLKNRKYQTTCYVSTVRLATKLFLTSVKEHYCSVSRLKFWAQFISTVDVTYPAHPIILDLINLEIFCESTHY
jgi:hypothetical protein